MDAVGTVLSTAADLVDAGWCQRTYAQDANGNYCSVDAERAAVFCARGAVHRAVLNLNDGHFNEDLLERATERLESTVNAAFGTRQISRWNDTTGRSQAQVSSAMRLAATAAKVA